VKVKKVAVLLVIGLTMSLNGFFVSKSKATTNPDSLAIEIQKLRSELDQAKKKTDTAILVLMKELNAGKSDHQAEPSNAPVLGGYGEIHLNGVEGSGGEYADIHRFVLFLGYHFNDWISFDSETEIEHAYIKDGNGEISIEQLYVNLNLNDHFNIKLGRILVPVGIVNQHHEPPVFHGVERPTMEKNIIPTTWFGEGGGFWGQINSALSYELYLLNGLDASQFSGSSGIRSGRMKERPGYNNPAVTSRLSYSIPTLGPLSKFKLGASAYYGGGNNTNKGGDTGLVNETGVYSGDLQFNVFGFDVKSVFAQIYISNAGQIGNNVPKIASGYYAELARDILPETIKNGRLQAASLYLFTRYDVSDNQFEMPQGVAANPSYSRTEITLGLTFLPIHNFSIKTDMQIPGDDTNEDLPKRFNFGVGWYF